MPGSPRHPDRPDFATAGDFDNRTRYLNMRNTLVTLFEWDVLRSLIENDTISVDEIASATTTTWAALVTNLIQAPCS